MAFDDVRLPVDVEVGAEGGPTFSTGIIATGSGQEQRVQNWSTARHSYTIGYGISETDWQAVRAFFYARRGRARGFRFRDWTDYQCDGEPVRVANNTAYIVKTYADDIGLTYTRAITRVFQGTLVLHLIDDSGVTDVTPLFTESYGRLKFVGPGAQPDLTKLHAICEFDIPTRFDVDELAITASTILAAEISSLKLIELIEDSDALNGGPPQA